LKEFGTVIERYFGQKKRFFKVVPAGPSQQAGVKYSISEYSWDEREDRAVWERKGLDSDEDIIGNSNLIPRSMVLLFHSPHCGKVGIKFLPSPEDLAATRIEQGERDTVVIQRYTLATVEFKVCKTSRAGKIPLNIAEEVRGKVRVCARLAMNIGEICGDVCLDRSDVDITIDT